MVEESSNQEGKLGMISGVFVPTVLTILGVIMFLRLGWVVGNVGLLGSWAVIGLAFFITGITALSMSSIITNMKIGAGGAYSIIARSLGLEVGGSIGLPLYLSLSLSMVMYIFGFRAGIKMIFPQHSSLLIDFAAFSVLFLIVFLSTSFAFKIQYVILAVVIGSIISVLATGINFDIAYNFTEPKTTGSFWTVFAVFFPAATGIMAGANMSGELKDPKKSIPIGTLSAIIVSVIIYLVLAFWLKGAVSSDELINNYLVLIDESFYAPVVLGGLLAATFSSALNSLVGASRILQAMGEHNILPGSGWFSKKSRSGVPRNAIIITGIIVVLGLLVRSLNTIAPLITMFFLITYAMLNVVILLEQQLELVSFRPLLKVPRFIPLLGAGGSFFAMFIINPVFGIVAVSVVVIFYYVLMHRHLGEGTPYGDVRSSLFVALAEWAAKKSSNLPISKERAWVPNILIPSEHPTEIRGVSGLLRDITYPRGSISMLGVNIEKRNVRVENQFKSLSESFKDDGIYSDYTIVEGKGFADDTIASLQTLRRSLFSPNIAFLRMSEESTNEEEIDEIIKKATGNRLGVILFANHSSAGLGQRKVINLWIPEQCQEWEPPEKLPNCDLSILIAYKLKINWNADFNLIAPTGDKENIEEIEGKIDNLIETGRLPVDNIEVVPDELDEYIEKAPQADLNIFSLSPKLDFTAIRERLRRTNSACMYCRDSTEESALA